MKLTRAEALALRDSVATWDELLDAIPRELLTTSNPKTAKGEAHGYRTAVLHLAPARLSGRNVCPHSSPGCRAGCLNTAGHGGMGLDENGLNQTQVARIRRTRLWQRDRRAFMTTLVGELGKHARASHLNGLTPAARLNALSDLPWERFPVTRDGEEHPNVMSAFPEVRFYDYTKWPLRLRPLVAGIPNYSLTFSLAESNDDKAAAALEAGANVAVVFDTAKGQPLPESFAIAGVRRPVIDGDASDLRFLDPDGVIVGLRAKGRAIGDDSGFVRREVTA